MEYLVSARFFPSDKQAGCLSSVKKRYMIQSPSSMFFFSFGVLQNLPAPPSPPLLSKVKWSASSEKQTYQWRLSSSHHQLLSQIWRFVKQRPSLGSCSWQSGQCVRSRGHSLHRRASELWERRISAWRHKRF